MLYISDSNENIAGRQAAVVNWEHYSPAASSDLSLGSSILVVSSQTPSLQSGAWSAAGSSGWPSLLNIASTASLLSSYTPPALHNSALTPVDDADELSDAAVADLLQASDSEENPASPFGRKAPEQRPRVGPMDIDHNDHDSSWLNASTTANAADSAEEPSRKRRFLGTQQQSDSNNSNDSQHQQPVLSSAPFLFSMPPAMPVEPMVVDWNAGADAVRSNDNLPVSPNATRRMLDRRRNHASGAMPQREPSASSEQRFSRIHESPMVDEPTTLERLQMYRDLPYVISGYLQLGFNIFMVATVLVIMVHVLLTIQRDVNARVQEYSAEILHEIAACSKQYLDNRCDPLMRVPAMEQACQAWDNCMHRDPTKVGRARVSAETLAEIINGFIEPISLKTMLFFVIMFLGTLFISNFAFGVYRHSRVHHQHVSQSGGNSSAPYPGSPGPSTTHYRSYMHPRPRNDDPMATPTPKSGTTAHPLAPSSAMSSSLTRRDHSAHSIRRRHSPYR
ncbi:hypothetical protein H4S08_000835 [Coemansia sp. RSA 1365]|nr:hypothetical protein H4S08_000835 [Coemansia sp. RSA 1365]